MSDVTTTFGERLHHLRRALELSTERMARRLGVSDQTVYRWQRLSEPYPRAVKAVRSAFPHVRAAWLTHGEEPVFSSAPPHGLEEQGRSPQRCQSPRPHLRSHRAKPPSAPSAGDPRPTNAP